MLDIDLKKKCSGASVECPTRAKLTGFDDDDDDDGESLERFLNATCEFKYLKWWGTMWQKTEAEWTIKACTLLLPSKLNFTGLTHTCCFVNVLQ